MIYVESNQVDKQKIATSGISPTHYIFSLDDSGSMTCNNRWNNLMAAFKNSIETIRKIPQAETYIRISILI